MAYVLGFFAADGSMICNNRGAHFIEFKIIDKPLLVKIRKVLDSNHVISKRIQKTHWRPQYRLQIGSKEMYQDLTQLGFVQAKSKKLAMPPVPRMFISDFVRGYFDGDGCVYFKKLAVEGRKNKRWIFSSRFTSGSKMFLLDLHTTLGAYKIKGGCIMTKERGYELVFSHHDSLALYRLMYNNSPSLYLPRKYKKFRKAIKTLYGGVAQLG